MPTFQTLFPNFQSQCSTLYTALLPVATVLIIAGLIGIMKHTYTTRSMLRAIIGSMMIVMAIAEWGNWMDTAADSLQSVTSQMNANPQQAAQQYIDILVSKEPPQQKNGWFGLPTATQMSEALLWSILNFVGLAAQFVIWAAYIIQQFLIGFAYAFSPIFLGFLALQSTRLTGIRFITNTAGIIAWPLGWAAASIGTSNLINAATTQGLILPQSVYSLQTILAAAVVGGWIILTTIIAPVVIQTALATAGNVGGGLLGGAITTAAGTASSAAATGAALASGGAAVPLIIAGSGAAAATHLAGAAMHGNGGPLSGSLVQSVAFNMGRNKSSSRPKSNDPQGGGGAQGPSPTPFNPNDPGNDGPVQQMIDNSARERGAF